MRAIRSTRKGFTLVELLVVIAIIGLLSSAVFAGLNSARVKARDAKRVLDLRTLQTALELYYDRYGTYLVAGEPAGGAVARGLWDMKAAVTT